MREAKVDILKCFGEDSTLYYNDPANMWRMTADFEKILANSKENEERLLKASNLDAQRQLLRIKLETDWLVLEMIQPFVKIFKHEKVPSEQEEEDVGVDDSFESTNE